MRKYRYMLYRLLAAVFAVCLVATAQTLSVKELASFLESSVRLKQADRDVANYLAKVKLKERLDDRAIEEMEGLGIGPKTVQALNALRDRTQALASAAPIVPAAPPKPIPIPSSEEQAAIINDMREYALGYSKNLPDFICTQVTRRYAAPKPGMKYGGSIGSDPAWQKMDELTIRLSYFEQKEDYKLILVNNTPAKQDYRSLGGSTSSGDFGSMLKEIFEPSTEARFEWDGWTTLRTHLQMAFTYHVSQANSKWHLVVKDARLDIVPAYHGRVVVDKDTHVVMRVTLEADGIPADFPIKKAKEILDYDYTDISGHTFLLPLKGQMDMDGGDFLTMNTLEFHLYKKYSAESEIKYTEIPPEIPAEKTTETPATKSGSVDCKDPKNKDLRECKGAGTARK